MTENKTLQYAFANGARIATKPFQGKPVTIVGKVEKINSANDFIIRSSDGK